MSRISKVILILLCVIAAVGIAGSAGIYYTAENELIENNDFYFYKDEDQASDLSLSEEKILAYEPKYAEYSTDIYYSNLNDSEKLIYKAFIYAFENNEACIFIPESYIPSGEYTITDILYFVALDSPLVEQNVASAEQSEKSQVTQKDLLGFTHTKEVQGNYFYVDNFNSTKMQYKDDAIREAQKLVDSIPSNLTSDREKAKYIYEYISENSVYRSYGEDYYTANFLYDAIVDKETNCDGFTNEFALLCNMSGIECFEKMTLPQENEDGHTWNCVKIDGKYYNVDVTNAVEIDNVKGEKHYNDMFLFFPDSYSLNEVEYKDMIPECTDKSLSIIDCSFTNESDTAIAAILASKYKGNNSKYVCAYFSNMSVKRLDGILDRFLYSIDTGINYYTEEPVNSKVHFVVILPN